ncbi:MAG: hypothetical protein HYR60_22115 [Acidobacteria bacterium]|nr:hypothetical protein [Acidobacteriota bacterium]
MKTDAFCYFGALKAPKLMPQLTALLPEKERGEVAAVWEQLKALPAGELKSRWQKLRESENAAARQLADLKARGKLELLPPMWRRRIYELVRDGERR